MSFRANETIAETEASVNHRLLALETENRRLKIKQEVSQSANSPNYHCLVTCCWARTEDRRSERANRYLWRADNFRLRQLLTSKLRFQFVWHHDSCFTEYIDISQKNSFLWIFIFPVTFIKTKWDSTCEKSSITLTWTLRARLLWLNWVPGYLAIKWFTK